MSPLKDAPIPACARIESQRINLSRPYPQPEPSPGIRLFQIHLQSNPPLALSAVDGLAIGRVRPALSNPRAEVEKITDILTREFTRLYRKRNMIVHGAQIQESSLHSLSETLAPLIGAGIDRVVHVGLKFEVPPIELSAIADSRLHYLTPSSPTDPGNLLEMLEF